MGVFSIGVVQELLFVDNFCECKSGVFQVSFFCVEDSLMNLFSELFVVESLGLAGELAVDISLVAVEML